MKKFLKRKTPSAQSRGQHMNGRADGIIPHP